MNSNSLLTKHYSPDEQPSSGGKVINIAKQALVDWPLTYNIPQLDGTAKNKIQEVGDLLQQSMGDQPDHIIQSAKMLLIQVQEWISHPIFRDERSLMASAIFAHGFGKILCAENLKYIAQLMNTIHGTAFDFSGDSEVLIAMLKNIQYELENSFTDNPIRNRYLHRSITTQVNRAKINHKHAVDIGDSDASQKHFICMKLLEQIEGEIATNSISSLNGHPDIYRSHYFDFIAGMEKSHPELLRQYRCAGGQGLEQDYMSKLMALLRTGGDDAVAAVTLMSESFIGLTYKTILGYVLDEKTLQDNPLAKELQVFYEGHIELDGVEQIDSTDTHFEMVKHMLTQVKDWDQFLITCRRFITLRNDVHNALMKE